MEKRYRNKIIIIIIYNNKNNNNKKRGGGGLIELSGSNSGLPLSTRTPNF